MSSNSKGHIGRYRLVKLIPPVIIASCVWIGKNGQFSWIHKYSDCPILCFIFPLLRGKQWPLEGLGEIRISTRITHSKAMVKMFFWKNGKGCTKLKNIQEKRWLEFLNQQDSALCCKISLAQEFRMNLDPVLFTNDDEKTFKTPINSSQDQCRIRN